jgi:uncharacterized protein
MPDLLWYSADLASTEHFTADLPASGPRLRGTVALPIDDEPAHLTYEIVADPGWRARRAEIAIERPGGSRRIQIVADGEGRWTVDGEPAPALDGCLDVDLGWTPATNTFQIRRLGLAVGQQGTVPVAWMTFPELVLERSDQTYERLGSRSWRFSSGNFTAVLDVDEAGFVRRYGDDLWRALASA